MLKFKLLFCVVILPLILLFWRFGCSGSSSRRDSSFSSPSTLPAALTPSAPSSLVNSRHSSKSEPSSPLPSGYCPNWGSSSSGLFWGYSLDGYYYEGNPVFYIQGNPVFSDKSRRGYF